MVDDASVVSYNMQASFSPYTMDVGIETSDTGNTFDEQTIDNYLYYYDSNRNEHSWSSGGIVGKPDDANANALGLKNKYHFGDNSIWFYTGSSSLISLNKGISKSANQLSAVSIPTYTSNMDKSIKTLKNSTDILNKINLDKSTNVTIKSISSKTWKAHLKNDEPTISFNDSQISPDRSVYVVTTSYPDGINTKAGFYANATVYLTYDAQTGDLLESFTTGNYKGK